MARRLSQVRGNSNGVNLVATHFVSLRPNKKKVGLLCIYHQLTDYLEKFLNGQVFYRFVLNKVKDKIWSQTKNIVRPMYVHVLIKYNYQT